MNALGDSEAYLGTPRVTLRVGADLRAARERLGWTLPAIAAYLRIRLPFLEAIEDGRIGDLPGNAYAVGFLRTYAQALGLDPEEVTRRFKAEAADVNRKTELAFPAPVPERGIPAGAVVLVGVVIAIGAYIGWYRMSGGDRPSSDMVQAVPERLAPLAATAAPAPLTQAASAVATDAVRGDATHAAPSTPSVPGSASASTSSATTPSVMASAPPSLAPGAASPVTAPGPTPQMMGPPVPPGIAASLGPSPVATAIPAVGASVGEAAANVPMPPVFGAAVPFPQGLPRGTRIVLRAKAEAWVQVREKQGTVLLNRVMRNGEIWPVPLDKQPLLLTTGNAGGTELIVDGLVTPSLGADGVVRRDLPLDAETLREGKLVPLAPGGPAAAVSGRPVGAPGIPVSRTN